MTFFYKICCIKFLDQFYSIIVIFEVVIGHQCIWLIILCLIRSAPQEKPPPETSAKSNKLENLKRYQQQVFQNRLGATNPVSTSSTSNPVYTGSNPVYGVANPVYPGGLITKASLYGRPSKEGFTAQYETEYVRSKPLFVARDQASLGYSTGSSQHFYRDDSSPEQVR